MLEVCQAREMSCKGHLFLPDSQVVVLEDRLEALEEGLEDHAVQGK